MRGALAVVAFGLFAAAPATAAVELVPASGEAGGQAMLVARELAPLSEVELRVANERARVLETDARGHVTVGFQVPSHARGDVPISVKDEAGRASVLRYEVRSPWSGERSASAGDWEGRLLRVDSDLIGGRLENEISLSGVSPGTGVVVRFEGQRVARLRADDQGDVLIRLRLPGEAVGKPLDVRVDGGRLATELPTPPAVFVVTGDVACPPDEEVEESRCRQADTARLVARLEPDAVALAGDTQNPSGSRRQFMEAFHPSWGQLEVPLRPVPGNHEYRTAGAEGFFDYFEFQSGWRPPPWYGYNVGPWRFLALNSNCESDRVNCGEGSEQLEWLRASLAAEPRRCTLAYWHHPRFSSGFHGSDRRTSPFWQALDEAEADIAVAGHDHHYERFAPQDHTGEKTATGVRQFVAGLGGHYPSVLRSPRAPHSEWAQNRELGVLLFRLYEDAYSWRFVGLSGRVLDFGNGSCV